MGHALAFDTLTFSSNLQEAGMDEKQAKALATGLYNSQDRIIDNLATKQDVELVKKDLEVVKQELDSKVDMVKKDLESKMDKLDAKFDSKIDKLDSKVDLIRKDMETSNNLIRKDMDLIRKDMETSNNLIRKDMASNHQLVKWMIGTTLAAVVTILIRSFS
jgi:hypothetical protein